MSIRRLLSLAAAGLMCAGAIASTSGVAVAATASASHIRLQPGGTMLRAAGNSSNYPSISINWSGYAVLSKTPFNYVHSTFVQPSVRCPYIKNQFTSNWVGLDGYNTDTVEQDGTFALCGGRYGGTPVYEAWYEMYPKGSVNVFPVHPGDTISETVQYTGGKFVLSVADLTSKKSFTTKATCESCQRASAEWIVERPAICLNRECTKAALTQLANFGTTTMAQDKVSVDGGAVTTPGAFNNYPIYMFCPLKRGLISLDTVSALHGASFTATWDRRGKTTPITLGPRG